MTEHVQMHDSMEAMFAAMAEAEEKANAALHPQQVALRDATETMWWVRPYAAADCMIFGEAPTVEALIAIERKYYPTLDDPAAAAADPEAHAEALAEWEGMPERLAERRKRGYLTGQAYSILEPRGEGGDTHVANAWPITQEAFEQARAADWQPTPDNAPALIPALLELMEAQDEARLRAAIERLSR